MALMEFVVFTL